MTEHTANTPITDPMACSGIRGELYAPTLSSRSCQRNCRMASLLAWIMSTPKVVEATVFMNGEEGILRFLKNRKVDTETHTAKMRLESDTNIKGDEGRPNSRGGTIAHTTTLRAAIAIMIRDAIPQNFVFSNSFFG